MEAIILAAFAAQVAQRMYQVTSTCYQALPKPSDSIVIEITSSDGKTTFRELIATTKPLYKILSLIDSLSYHLHTIFLFTYSDFKTVLIPWALFGVSHALSATAFGVDSHPSTLSVFIRLPQIMAWVYLNLLPFTISNQRQPSAILEDSLNKSWRPIPAERITATSAQYIMIVGYIVAAIFSFRFGGLSQTIVLAVLGYLYNDLGGSDSCFVYRHLLNGLGFISFGSGAMEVAFGRSITYSPLLIQWLRILALVVATGIHAADMYDQAGDKAVDRSTLPLVISDKPARYVLALSTLAWSVFCPYFWQLSLLGYVLPVIGGAYVAMRTLTKKSVKSDKTTYKVWNLWLAVVYCLPLVKMAA